MVCQLFIDGHYMTHTLFSGWHYIAHTLFSVWNYLAQPLFFNQALHHSESDIDMTYINWN